MLKGRQQGGGGGRPRETTQLHTHRSDVDRVNAQELARLEGAAREFVARDDGHDKALEVRRMLHMHTAHTCCICI